MTTKKRGRKSKNRKAYSTYISPANYNYLRREAKKCDKTSLADILNIVIDNARRT